MARRHGGGPRPHHSDHSGAHRHGTAHHMKHANTTDDGHEPPAVHGGQSHADMDLGEHPAGPTPPIGGGAGDAGEPDGDEGMGGGGY